MFANKISNSLLVVFNVVLAAKKICSTELISVLHIYNLNVFI